MANATSELGVPVDGAAVRAISIAEWAGKGWGRSDPERCALVDHSGEDGSSGLHDPMARHL